MDTIPYFTEYHVISGVQLGGPEVRITVCGTEGPEFEPRVGKLKVF